MKAVILPRKSREFSDGEEFAFLPDWAGAYNQVTRATRVRVLPGGGGNHPRVEVVQPLTPGLVDPAVAWECSKKADLVPVVGEIDYTY